MSVKRELSPVSKSGAHCHKLVAETAKALTHELYDRLMGDNRVFAQWKKDHEGMNARQLEDEFVRMNWGKSIPVARTTLALILRGPLDSHLKEQISEALILDNTLVRGRDKKVRQL